LDDADDEGQRRADAARRKAKADRYVGRFPVTDLAVAVAARGESRKKLIEAFVRTIPQGSYAVTRGLMRRIYNAQPVEEFALFRDLPPDPWPAIEKAIRGACEPQHLADNLEAADLLFKHARSDNLIATIHEAAPLRVKARSYISIGIDLYVTIEDRLVFEFVHFRRTPLTPPQAAILSSLVHYAYCVGDFAHAEVDIVSICGKRGTPRTLTRSTVPRSDLLSREELDTEIEDVYRLLWTIAGA
jgi:hypothetical protein